MIVPLPVAARARRPGALSAGILALALLACGAACAASAANTITFFTFNLAILAR